MKTVRQRKSLCLVSKLNLFGFD